MSHDDRTVPPVQTAMPEGGADVGGIPATLNQGVDHATDRAAGRREGTPESDAGGGPRPSLPVSGESAALAPRPARDTTGSPAVASDATGSGTAATAQPGGAGGNDADRDDARANDARRANGDGSGQDDSLAESLGKAIAEPFKSD